MNDRITLKNIKYSAFASEETHCFQATVYFDNKKVGSVSNSGHGGADYEYPSDNEGWAAMEEYISTLPAIVTDLPPLSDDEEHFTMKQSLETICCDLVNKWLTEKDVKRILKNNLAVIKDGDLESFARSGELHQFPLRKKGWTRDALVDGYTKIIREQYPKAVILNELPLERVVQLFGGAA